MDLNALQNLHWRSGPAYKWVGDLIVNVFSREERALLFSAEGFNSTVNFRKGKNEFNETLPLGTKGNIFMKDIETATRYLIGLNTYPRLAANVLWQTEPLMRLILDNGFIHHTVLEYGDEKDWEEYDYDWYRDPYLKPVKEVPLACNKMLWAIRKLAELIDGCWLYPDAVGDYAVLFEIDSNAAGQMLFRLELGDLAALLRVKPETLNPDVFSSKVDRLASTLRMRLFESFGSKLQGSMERLKIKEKEIEQTFKEIVSLIPSVIDETLSLDVFVNCAVHTISLMSRVVAHKSCCEESYYLGVQPAWEDRDHSTGDITKATLVRGEVGAFYLLF